jgi:hypothetical protein
VVIEVGIAGAGVIERDVALVIGVEPGMPNLSGRRV